MGIAFLVMRTCSLHGAFNMYNVLKMLCLYLLTRNAYILHFN